METKILKKMNDIAKDYVTSRNLIRNINKRYESDFKITSCEESGVGYRVIKVIDNQNNDYKYKLFENNNRLEFKLFSSQENYSTQDLWDILKTGNIKITKDSIVIELDDLNYEDYDIILKGLGRI